MANLQYGDYLELMNSATSKAHQPKTMNKSDAGAYLVGYLHEFRLRLPGTEFITEYGGAWYLPYLKEFWTRPGLPAIPLEELSRFETGRVNFIMREILAEAARRGELHRVTTHQGRALHDLLYRCGLGRYA